MSIAEKPERLTNMFLIDEKNSANIYAVKMYALGVPVTVTIDDYLPLETYYETLFARVSKDGALWGPILEKAFAKFLGNYEALEGGLNGPGIRMLTGSPYISHWHVDHDVDGLWEIIAQQKADHSMVTAGSFIGTGNDRDLNAVGLANAHAYSVLEAMTLSTGDRVLALRNPWGKETFNSTWSDSSEAWTEELREEANHTSNNDGKFFISIEDYKEYLEYTTISFDVSEAYQAYFLVLNDTYVKPGMKQDCGVNCTVHKFYVQSEIDQEVLISAHSWDDKHYLGDCMQHSAEKNIMWIPAVDYAYYFNQGSIQTPPIQMYTHNRTEVTVFMNYLSDEKEYVLGKDFSLVVWGRSGGKVTITHEAGLQSDHFTNIEPDPSIDIIFMQALDQFNMRDFILRFNKTEFDDNKLYNLDQFDFNSFDLPTFLNEYDFSSLDLAFELTSTEYNLTAFNLTDFMQETYGEYYLNLKKIEIETFMQEMFLYIEQKQLYSDPNYVPDSDSGTSTEVGADVYDEFKLDALTLELETWTKEQEQDKKEGFFCDFTVSLDFPFTSEDDDLMAVWAGHDCSQWDLYITLVLPRD